MSRYGIPEKEKRPYITDFLRGVPKAEAKAFLQEGKSAQDLLDFLHDSYAGGQALGELQHQFLERKQKRGEDYEGLCCGSRKTVSEINPTRTKHVLRPE